jgi:hypothetical protein
MTLLMRLAFVALCAAGLSTAQEEGLDWLDNYQEVLKQARQSGKPIFLEYRCEP